jgi:hypothetical protein
MRKFTTCWSARGEACLPWHDQDVRPSRDLPYSDDDLERTISIPAGRLTLEGTLGVPDRAAGLVLFAHGSGSSRFSPRNRYVARAPRDGGLGTLLLDLLSPTEEQVDEVTRHHRFDIPMLADRLVLAIDWLAAEETSATLPVGLFVISLNKRARSRMHGDVRLQIIPGATHLFEERGALEQVAAAARDWFLRHLHPSGATSVT